MTAASLRGDRDRQRFARRRPELNEISVIALWAARFEGAPVFILT